jgi:hypothetical protein
MKTRELSNVEINYNMEAASREWRPGGAPTND